jgi:hypothetical protein
MSSRQDRSGEELAMHDRLWKWFGKVATEAEAQAIVVHFGDLYGASDKLRTLIAGLVKQDPADRPAARRALLDIQTELYEHMILHMQELRAPLHDLLDRLYDDGAGRR